MPFVPNTAPTNRLPKTQITKRRERERERESLEREGLQEVIVGAEGEKMVDALDGGALENGPLTAEEGDHYQQRCRSMAHQKPRYGHPQTLPQTDK